MSGLALPVVLAALILGLLAARAWAVMRAERGARRGAEPGEGHHVIRSEYFSGGGGGGETTEYTVPKDPQAYARLFVPKTKNKTDKPKG
ncbi:hypothetical protein SAMN04488020_101490 [Palleronia marisminoris]|uniref:Uncharacterized protein n=1 Tax=Palleronia marisminoris TaxID=315423 RepID=A0A1Y5RH47_9RHOB|nr:hypothetical protein [Palleronia marisminoris]SFG20099.1 hypothetical protein SAMN04488020_101490 [Palleronia marisminoris]SLN17304.1 hypothetical protein PAM7066_00490 [Palleronia marisminoris]